MAKPRWDAIYVSASLTTSHDTAPFTALAITLIIENQYNW